MRTTRVGCSTGTGEVERMTRRPREPSVPVGVERIIAPLVVAFRLLAPACGGSALLSSVARRMVGSLEDCSPPMRSSAAHQL